MESLAEAENPDAYEDWTLNTTDEGVEARAQELFQQHWSTICRHTDRLFVVIMGLQWIGGILVALYITPQTWIGESSYVHMHVWATIFLGGLVTLVPVTLGVFAPGTTSTRHAIAFSQAIWSALLIHLTGGRIETHFHVFGSLAILAVYRDWRVLITASVVVTLDHFIRGVWWPLSVYGVLVESPFRWLEHAAWVVFEDVFLIVSCVRGTREGLEISRRRATLERAKAEVESRVEQRTRELSATTEELSRELELHRETQEQREKLHHELVTVSRQAGMAEVATGVLHNVGNVLNSVNVSTNLLRQRLHTSSLSRLVKAVEILRGNKGRIAEFLSNDERGRLFPTVLEELTGRLQSERTSWEEELQSLVDNIEHIKQIVSMQQTHARSSGASESVDFHDLLEDAVKMSGVDSAGHIKIRRCYAKVWPTVTDRHKVLQICINMISNAKHAINDSESSSGTIAISLDHVGETLEIEVTDTGVGISAENLNKIFSHGFTTRKAGHGFGLHHSVLCAQELGGSLSAASDGIGKGATFTFRLPSNRTRKPKEQPDTALDQDRSLDEIRLKAGAGASDHR